MAELYAAGAVFTVVIGGLTAREFAKRRTTRARVQAAVAILFAVLGWCVWGPWVVYAANEVGAPPEWAHLLLPVGLIGGTAVGIALAVGVCPLLVPDRTGEGDDRGA